MESMTMRTIDTHHENAMTDPSQPLNLELIKARERDASRGPWRVGMFGEDRNEPAVVFDDGGDSSLMMQRDAEFMAHARSDIPALIAEVERLRAENRALQAEVGRHD